MRGYSVLVLVCHAHFITHMNVRLLLRAATIGDAVTIDLSPQMRFCFRWGQRCALFRILHIIVVERIRCHDLVLQTSCNLCPALYSTLAKTNSIALHCGVSKMEKADALAHTTNPVSHACADAPVEQ